MSAHAGAMSRCLKTAKQELVYVRTAPAMIILVHQWLEETLIMTLLYPFHPMISWERDGRQLSLPSVA